MRLGYRIFFGSGVCWSFEVFLSMGFRIEALLMMGFMTEVLLEYQFEVEFNAFLQSVDCCKDILLRVIVSVKMDIGSTQARRRVYRSVRVQGDDVDDPHQMAVSFAPPRNEYRSRRTSRGVNFCVGQSSGSSQHGDDAAYSTSYAPVGQLSCATLSSTENSGASGLPVVSDIGVGVLDSNRSSRQYSSSCDVRRGIPDLMSMDNNGGANVEDLTPNQETNVSVSNNTHRSRRRSSSRTDRRNTRRRTLHRGIPTASDPTKIPSHAFRLKAPTHCSHCGALKFQYETAGFCCSNGEIKLPMRKFPEDLTRLYRGTDDDSLNFKKYGRLFNNLFAFSSLGGTFPCERSHGIFTFKAHGQIYHYLPNLVPSDQTPRYLQLYFYDAEHESENRWNLFKRELRPSVIARLMKIMEVNPYAQFFQSLRDKTIDDHTAICISKDPVFDQRVYNAPSSSEVAGILLDSTTSSDANGPHIIVTGKNAAPHRVMHYYGCYDPLQYPLLFPHGQPGWRRGLPRFNPAQGQTFVSFENPVMTAETAEELLLDEEMLAEE